MRIARYLTLIALAIGLAGCQTPDPSIELLESELRWYEDQLYLMDRKLGESGRQLESARRYNSSLEAELARATGDGPNADHSSESDRKRVLPLDILGGKKKQPDSTGGIDRNPQPPNGDFDDNDSDAIDELDVPEIDYGSSGNSEANGPSKMPGKPSGSTVEPDEVFDGEDGDFDLDDISQISPDRTVARVVFNKQLTGGHNADEQPGDDGIYVVLEPQSQNGSYTPTPGEITIEVFEANASRGPHSRIARWDFDAAETSVAMRKSLLGKGVHLELPWPAEPPAATDLVLTAKYVRGDGTRLTAEQEIKIDPTGRRILQLSPMRRNP